MSDKKGFMGLAALAAAGAGAAMLMKKTKEINEEETFHVKKTTENYRNTERGKYDKNSKGIYYSNGNYEAFARPEKPEGVDDKHAYIVGSGLASLAAACFLVRDAQMPGDHIHILEAMDIAGGACLPMYKVATMSIRASKIKRIETDWSEDFLTVPEAYYLATSSGHRYFGDGDGFAPGNRLHAIVVDDGDFTEASHPLTVRERFERAIYMLHRHNITAVWSDGRCVVGQMLQ